MDDGPPFSTFLEEQKRTLGSGKNWHSSPAVTRYFYIIEPNMGLLKIDATIFHIKGGKNVKYANYKLLKEGPREKW